MPNSEQKNRPNNSESDRFKQEENNRHAGLATAQRRTTPGSQEVRMIDALRLARHYGTSYSACLYQLLNLKLIQKETLEKLLVEQTQTQAEKVNSLLGGVPSHLEQETLADLTQMTVNLIVDALLQKQITRPRADEYMRLLDRNPQELESVIMSA